MGIKFSHLSIIGELPFPHPCIEERTGNFVLVHPISQRFRRRSIWVGLLMVAFFAAIMIFSFPYITGILPYSSFKIGKLASIFFGSIVMIPYFVWWITRNATSKEHTRQIIIQETHSALSMDLRSGILKSFEATSLSLTERESGQSKLFGFSIAKNQSSSPQRMYKRISIPSKHSFQCKYNIPKSFIE